MTLDIRPRDQDFSNVPLYIPNIKNYDGRAGRKTSDFVINSIDDNITGTLNITNQGFLNIRRQRCKIDNQIVNITANF